MAHHPAIREVEVKDITVTACRPPYTAATFTNLHLNEYNAIGVSHKFELQ